MVDNSGQDASLMRMQLFLVFRILVLVFGPNALKTRQSPFFLRHKKQLQRLIDLISFYCSTDQSFLVRALEQVDLNKELVKHCRGELQKALKTLPQASHAFLFAGTKLLSSFTKPDFAELHVQDVFSLLLYARSIFHPLEREVETDELPVADYTDHGTGLEATEAAGVSAAAAAAGAGEGLRDESGNSSGVSPDDAAALDVPPEESPADAQPAEQAKRRRGEVGACRLTCCFERSWRRRRSNCICE